MKALLLSIIILLYISPAIVLGDAKTFIMKNGDSITGDVQSYDSKTGIYNVKTSFGLISINDKDILKERIIITLKTGDTIKGLLLERTKTHYIVQTSYGELSILRSTIDQVDVAEKKKTKTDSPKTWEFSSEELMDLYIDPTGFTMKKDTLYISGLSWGYSPSHRFQITTQYLNFATGQYNLRPKWMIYKGGSLNNQSALSIGGHIHLGGSPRLYKREYKKNTYENTYSWHTIEGNDDSLLWGSVFLAFTQSSLKKDKRGRLSTTIGSEVTMYKDLVMPRVYAGISYDARYNLKLILLGYYDPYWGTSTSKKFDSSTPELIHILSIDYGFIYAYNEHLRIGLHSQRQYISIYYKF
ncbi:hypothetical protein CL658_02660 [bacterium]|nr:hypothetical protein [bacterium]|tara:strand:- start:813 stop:1877 length:1065 start_codon:yes stop_codon:yes gene_type:complete